MNPSHIWRFFVALRGLYVGEINITAIVAVFAALTALLMHVSLLWALIPIGMTTLGLVLCDGVSLTATTIVQTWEGTR